jgi:hypothetical protein
MITIVNIVPNSLSGETNQDSEPNIAVNPANSQEIAISAFTPDPMGGSNAPVYVSTDAGSSWTLNSIVPSKVGSSFGTGDITPRFAGRSGNFYAGILRDPGYLRLNVLRTSSFTSPTTMTKFVDRNQVDQPYTEAATVMGGPDVGKDRVYIGLNDFNAPDGKTATIEQSLDAGIASPTFTSVRLETRSTGSAGQDGPQIRPSLHPDGTLYVVFHGWRSFGSGNAVTTDVVVVRDDSWGTGASPFTALVDPGDGLAGRIVASGVSFTWNGTLGQERLGGDLAIAVDPNNSSIVYIAYCDVQSGAYTIHIRRSLNRGVTWSPDLKTISNAKNPALAINSQGKVGLAYQQVTGSGSSQRWETHFELTTNGFASSTDSVLATVPANTPTPQFMPYIGDYMGMKAAGKDFYGVFSANNTPDLANFPNGVTYLRNHNFTTEKLLDTDGTTEVAVSIDPFFFRVTDIEESADLYVRDWTDSATSHDTGLEPSSNPWFYVNPDVWNRRSNAPGGFTVNDQPINQDPQMAAMGSNFAFCRTSRNATGSAETASAHFLVSEFGTGSNYQDANVTPDPVISFAAGDLVQTMANGYEWLLPATSSQHLCLAVEIDSANDPLKLPGLIGRAPGWPTTDLIVINDNNKAQRNMGVHPVSGGASGTVSFYAIAHNAATLLRDMVLRFETDQQAIPWLEGALIEIVDGSGEVITRPFEQGTRIVLEKMLPGDNIWIGVTLTAPEGKVGQVIPVTVRETVDGKTINGFAFAARLSWRYIVRRANLELHAGSFLRIAEWLGLESAKEEGVSALELARWRHVWKTRYLSFLKRHLELMSKVLEELLAMRVAPDAFGLRAALATLEATVAEGDGLAAAAAHTTFVHKLDAYVTMLQKAQGDTANIMQTVAWQSALYQTLKEERALEIADEVIQASDEFVAAYQARTVGNEDYPHLISELFEAFKVTAEALGLDVEEDLVNMEENLEKSLAGLQKVHRGFLVKLHDLVS